jgi:hypothetical protein
MMQTSWKEIMNDPKLRERIAESKGKPAPGFREYTTDDQKRFVESLNKPIYAPERRARSR